MNNHRAGAYTTVMGLISSTMFMSITGGPLTPAEMNTIDAAAWSLLGDQAAAHTLESRLAYSPPRPSSATHDNVNETFGPPEPPLDPELALLGGYLLGGPETLLLDPLFPDPPVVAAVARCTQACALRPALPPRQHPPAGADQAPAPVQTVETLDMAVEDKGPAENEAPPLKLGA